MKTSGRSRRRSAAAITTLLLCSPVVGACGFNDQTEQVYQAGTGANNRSGEVDALGTVIVSADEGSGRLVTSLVNNSQSRGDQLVSVTSTDATSDLDSPITIPADTLVNLADTEPAVSLKGDFSAGQYVTLKLTFARATPVTFRVPVVTDSGDYNGVAVAPASSPSALDTPASGITPGTGDATASPSAAPSGAPSGAGPTDTPSDTSTPDAAVPSTTPGANPSDAG